MQPSTIARGAGSLAVALGIAAAYSCPATLAQAQPSMTISGPELEQLLRAKLTSADGSGADPSQIRCPSTRQYRDGDTVSCLIPTGEGSVEILLVTLFQESGGWRFAIDVQ